MYLALRAYARGAFARQCNTSPRLVYYTHTHTGAAMKHYKHYIYEYTPKGNPYSYTPRG